MTSASPGGFVGSSGSEARGEGLRSGFLRACGVREVRGDRLLSRGLANEVIPVSSGAGGAS